MTAFVLDGRQVVPTLLLVLLLVHILPGVECNVCPESWFSNRTNGHFFCIGCKEGTMRMTEASCVCEPYDVECKTTLDGKLSAYGEYVKCRNGEASLARIEKENLILLGADGSGGKRVVSISLPGNGTTLSAQVEKSRGESLNLFVPGLISILFFAAAGLMLNRLV